MSSNAFLIVRLLVAELITKLVAHLLAFPGEIRPFCRTPIYQLLRQSQRRIHEPTAVYGIPVRGTVRKLPQPHRAVNALTDICTEIE